MNFDFIGAEQNFIVVEKSEPVFSLAFIDADGAPVDLSGITFDGILTLPDDSTLPLDIWQDADNPHKLRLTFPAVEEVNSYRYELRALDDNGYPIRLAFGRVGVVSSKLDLSHIADEDECERSLAVHLPGDPARHILMKWRASFVAEAVLQQVLAEMEAIRAAASEAQDVYDKTKEDLQQAAREAVKDVQNAQQEASDAIEDAKRAAEEAKQTAEEAAQRAKDSADEAAAEAKRAAQEAAAESQAEFDRLADAVADLQGQMSQTWERLDVQITKYDIFLANFADNVQSVIFVDPATDHLIIGGVDTGCKVTGDPGKAPYIDERGHWMYFSDELQAWLDGGDARGEAGFSPYVDELGRIIYKHPITGEIVTGPCIMGKDGRDGTSVVRHMIESESRLPDPSTQPELCNGGHIFYVPAVSYEARARIDVLEDNRTSDDSFILEGYRVELPAPDVPAEQAAFELASSINALDGISANADSASVHIVARGQSLTAALIHSGGYAVTEYPYIRRSGYDVWAWVQQGVEESSGQWARVDEAAYDIATSEAYGMTKLATDAIISDGAAVGTNENGQLSVPQMNTTVQGASKLSTESTLGSGANGLIGHDASGHLMAQAASIGNFGTVKPAYQGAAELVNAVGIMSNGALGIPRASLYELGLVRLGSRFGQTNPIPFQMGVGANEDGVLANNLLYGGALRHMTGDAWIADQTWVDIYQQQHPEYFQDMYYLGLKTTLSFKQDVVNGLELNRAHNDYGLVQNEILGGVVLTSNPQEERYYAVMSAADTWKTLTDYSYSKAETSGLISLEISKERQNRITEDEKLQADIAALSTKLSTQVNNLRSEIAAAKQEAASSGKDAASSVQSALDSYIATTNAELKKFWVTTTGQAWVNSQLASYRKIADSYSKTETDTKLQTKLNTTTSCASIVVSSKSEDFATLSKNNPTTLYIQSEPQ